LPNRLSINSLSIALNSSFLNPRYTPKLE
jgi:hypothetical protein